MKKITPNAIDFKKERKEARLNILANIFYILFVSLFYVPIHILIRVSQTFWVEFWEHLKIIKLSLLEIVQNIVFLKWLRRQEESFNKCNRVNTKDKPFSVYNWARKKGIL